MSKKSILVICYTFPPSPGIGGRRWAKFAKYMSRENYTIYVACATNLSQTTSEWLKDIEKNENIKILPFEFSHQRLFSKPGNITKKITAKLLSKLLRLTKHSERFLTSFPNKPIWNRLAELIETKKIKTIIVSGDPFLFYYGSQLAHKTSSKLILDYRDLWNDHSFYKRHFDLSAKQKQFFETAENTALENCNKVVTVDDHLKRILSARLKNNKKIVPVSNGYDTDDFTSLPGKHNDTSGKIKILFAGNIASDLNEIVLHFIKTFAELKKTNPKLYSIYEIHIDAIMDEELFNKIASFGSQNLFITRGLLPLEKYLVKLSGSDAGIVMLSEEYANSFITKFTDYLYLDKFVLTLGFKGEFSDFLLKNNCGCLFSLQDNTDFFSLLHEKIKKSSPIDQRIKDTFSLGHLTRQYIDVIEK